MPHVLAGAKEGFFSSLVDCVVDQMGDTYPELIKSRENIRCALGPVLPDPWRWAWAE